jgi:hypothetical protein
MAEVPVDLPIAPETLFLGACLTFTHVLSFPNGDFPPEKGGSCPR